MGLYGIFKESPSGLTPTETKSFLDDGFIVMLDLLTLNQIEEMRNKIFKFILQQELDLKEKGVDIESLNEKDLLRCPLFYDRSFYEYFCLNDKVLSVVKGFLGENFQIHLQNAIVNRPNLKHHQSTWHQDFPYQPYVTNRPMGVGVLFCLSDFMEETGGTYFVKGSHKFNVSDHREEFLEKEKVCPPLKAGGAIFFDPFVWHRAGFNSSKNDRIAVNNLFTTPIIKQQISLPDFLPSGYAVTLQDEKLLGFQWKEPRSVMELRLNKVKKL